LQFDVFFAGWLAYIDHGVPPPPIIAPMGRESAKNFLLPT